MEGVRGGRARALGVFLADAGMKGFYGGDVRHVAHHELAGDGQLLEAGAHAGVIRRGAAIALVRHQFVEVCQRGSRGGGLECGQLAVYLRLVTAGVACSGDDVDASVAGGSLDGAGGALGDFELVIVEQRARYLVENQYAAVGHRLFLGFGFPLNRCIIGGAGIGRAALHLETERDVRLLTCGNGAVRTACVYGLIVVARGKGECRQYRQKDALYLFHKNVFLD